MVVKSIDIQLYRLNSPFLQEEYPADKLPYRNRKINTSPQTIDDKEYLKKPLTDPMVKKIDLHFPLGLEVTARNMKGVTIKDALDAIHKQFKKKVCQPHDHAFASSISVSRTTSAALFPLLSALYSFLLAISSLSSLLSPTKWFHSLSKSPPRPVFSLSS